MDLNGLACCELRKDKGEQINKKNILYRDIFLWKHICNIKREKLIDRYVNVFHYCSTNASGEYKNIYIQRENRNKAFFFCKCKKNCIYMFTYCTYVIPNMARLQYIKCILSVCI